MDLAEVLTNCLAGLGLLFVGIKMVTRNLGAVAGDRIRRAISWASARTGVAMAVGAMAGFVAQSGRTTSFVIEELELVERMTAGQGAAMERVRKKYLSLADSMAEADRIRILQLTSVFEHAAWSLRNFAQLLSASFDGIIDKETSPEPEARIIGAVA